MVIVLIMTMILVPIIFASTSVAPLGATFAKSPVNLIGAAPSCPATRIPTPNVRYKTGVFVNGPLRVTFGMRVVAARFRTWHASPSICKLCMPTRQHKDTKMSWHACRNDVD
jgi:hypothetical protein